MKKLSVFISEKREPQWGAGSGISAFSCPTGTHVGTMTDLCSESVRGKTRISGREQRRNTAAQCMKCLSNNVSCSERGLTAQRGVMSS